MIPATGWLAFAQNTNGPVLDKVLPVPAEGTYTDSTAEGRPFLNTIRRVGNLRAFLKVRTRFFTITIIRYGTHGNLLMDRVE